MVVFMMEKDRLSGDAAGLFLSRKNLGALGDAEQ